MKKLEELGISPTPWSVESTPNILHPDVISSVKTDIVCIGCRDYANARLIAAAPELYKCLREAVVENCHDCGNLDNEMSAYQDDFVCHNDKCFVKKWRHALAKAAGEEVTDGR